MEHMRCHPRDPASGSSHFWQKRRMVNLSFLSYLAFVAVVVLEYYSSFQLLPPVCHAFFVMNPSSSSSFYIQNKHYDNVKSKGPQTTLFMHGANFFEKKVRTLKNNYNDNLKTLITRNINRCSSKPMIECHLKIDKNFDEESITDTTVYKNSKNLSPYQSETGCSQFDDRGKVDFACGLIGADVELGLFDPLGLSNGKTEKEMKYYREAEIVHGRIAMIAVFGWLVPDTKTFLPSLSEGTSVANNFSKLIFGVSSLSFQETDPIKALSNVPFQMGLEIALLISIAEIYRYFRIIKGNYEPGDLNLDPYGLTLPLMEGATNNTDWEGSVPKFRGDRFGENAIESRIFNLEPKGQRIIKVAEIKHGRLAMLSILGLMAQYAISGQSFCEQMHLQYGFTAFR